MGVVRRRALRPPLPVAAIAVGAFAVFHGYARGAEMPVASDALSYALGFVIATGLLHSARDRPSTRVAGSSPDGHPSVTFHVRQCALWRHEDLVPSIG